MTEALTEQELKALKLFLRHVSRLFATPLAKLPPEKVQRSVRIDYVTGESTHTWQGYDEERLLAQLPLIRQCLLTDFGTAFTNVCGLIIRKCPTEDLRDRGKEVAKAWKQILHSSPDDWDAVFFGDKRTLYEELMEFFYGMNGLFHTDDSEGDLEGVATGTPVRLHMSLSNLFRCLGNAHWIVTKWLEAQPPFVQTSGDPSGCSDASLGEEEAD